MTESPLEPLPVEDVLGIVDNILQQDDKVNIFTVVDIISKLLPYVVTDS